MLPRSMELRDWVKIEPVRIMDLRVAESELARAGRQVPLGTFRLKRAAGCTYWREDATAVVRVIEAETIEDAFGVFSVLTSTAGAWHPQDGSVRAVEPLSSGVMVSGWQGRVFIQLRCTGAGGRLADDGEELLIRMLFSVPAAEPPALARLLWSKGADRRKVWIARSTVPLAATQHPVLKRLEPATVDAGLGLKGDLFISVAEMPAPGAAEANPPHVIWLVRYPDQAAAQAAHDRYALALPGSPAALSEHTVMAEPKAGMLLGTWTGRDDSVHQLLPALLGALTD